MARWTREQAEKHSEKARPSHRAIQRPYSAWQWSISTATRSTTSSLVYTQRGRLATTKRPCRSLGSTMSTREGLREEMLHPPFTNASSARQMASGAVSPRPSLHAPPLQIQTLHLASRS